VRPDGGLARVLAAALAYRAAHGEASLNFGAPQQAQQARAAVLALRTAAAARLACAP
jgi:hypothetical protein